MEKATLMAPEISCDHCIASIKRAVTKLPGVEFVSGDAAAKTVTLRYDPAQAELGANAEAMAREGYSVAR